MKRSTLLRCALAAASGLAVSSAHPLGMAVAVAMPAFVLRQPTRRSAYAAAVSYYGAALWPLIPGANNFFGPHVSALLALALWAVALLALASPWALLWTRYEPRQFLWRAPAALFLTVIPPLGIIGWASPLTASGFLFPGHRMVRLGCVRCGVGWTRGMTAIHWDHDRRYRPCRQSRLSG